MIEIGCELRPVDESAQWKFESDGYRPITFRKGREGDPRNADS